MDRKWWTLLAVCIGTFMLLLDVTIVNVALPSIQTAIKANFSDLQWVVDAYALTLAALLLTTGSLADLWGRRLIFVIGLVVFTLSSLACGLAHSPLWLNLARGAQGVGGAAMFSTSLALLGSSFRGRERGVAFGVWGAITGLAVAVGPLVGGALTSGLSWRWIFLVNVPIGVIAVAISLLRVEESKMPRARKPDPIGVVTFSGALAALVYALIKGDSQGWTSHVILGCLILAAALLILFLIAELMLGDRAMFDLRLFRKPTFTGGALAAFGLSAGLFALFLYLTLYMQDVLGYSALQTGLRFLVLSGGILLTSTLAGRLTAHVPIRFLIAPGLLLVGIGLLLMRGVTASTGYDHLIPGFILAGAGTGLINPPLASTAIGVVRPERAGMASGINSTFRQVGIATGIAGLGAIFTHQVRTTIESLLHGSWYINSAQVHSLASSVASGNGAKTAIEKLPASARGPAVHALRASFASGLNEIFLVGAALSMAGALLTLVLIRSKDFEEGAARTVPQPAAAGADEAAAAPGDGAPSVPVQGPAGPATNVVPAGPVQETAEVPINEVSSGPVEESAQMWMKKRPADPAEETPTVSEGAPSDPSHGAGGVLGEGAPTGADAPAAQTGDGASTSAADESSTAEETPTADDSPAAPATASSDFASTGNGAPAPTPGAPPTAVPGEDAGRTPTGYLAERLYGPGNPRPLRREDESKVEAEASDLHHRAAGTSTGAGVTAALHRRMIGYGYKPRSPVPPPPPPPSLGSPAPNLPGSQPPESRPEPWSEAEGSSSPDLAFEPPTTEAGSGTDLGSHTPAGPGPDTDRNSSSAPQAGTESEPSPGYEPGGPEPRADTEPAPTGERSAVDWFFRSVPRSPEPSTPAEPDPAGEPAAPAEPYATPTPESSSWPEVDAPSEASSPIEPDVTAESSSWPEADVPAEPSSPTEADAPAESDAPAGLDVTAEPDATTEPRAAEGFSQPFEPSPGSGSGSTEEPGFPSEPRAVEPPPYSDPSFEPTSDGPPPVGEPTESAPTQDTSALSSPEDMSMTPDLPVPDAPNTRDVRLVAQAVQSAEDAALAYARAIGEARRYMASAIEHLDQAEQARELLNQHASGFAPHTRGGSAPQDESAAAAPASDQGGPAAPSGPAGAPAYDPGTQHASGVMSTPSPGIAIAGPNPPGEDPATPNRPGPPPPPPGGWGPGAGGTP